MSAAVMQGCADPVSVPRAAGQDDQWRLWSADRRALEECKRLDTAKAATIRAMQAVRGERAGDINGGN